MMDIINVPLGWIMKGCYIVTNNYALALLLFAVALQIILLPFGIKQQKNSVKQAKLRPKEQAIRKKYAGRNDKATQQKLQNEIMELYQRENFNPMGGCLPLLIQMPILFALYYVVTSPLRYICGFGKEVIANIQAKVYEIMSVASDAATNGFEAFAADKTVRQIELIKKMRELGLENFVGENGEAITEEILPNFHLAGNFMDLSAIPTFKFEGEAGWLLLIPLFTLIFTFASQWITKKFTYNPNMQAQNDMSMKMMQYSMPLLSVYITFVTPATIGLYWIFRNILSTIQTILLAKFIPVPQFTEADYKAAEKEYNVKPAKKNNGEKKKVRSLHRIDDEDDDEPVKPQNNSKKPELKDGVSESEAPKLKDESERDNKKAEEN